MPITVSGCSGTVFRFTVLDSPPLQHIGLLTEKERVLYLCFTLFLVYFLLAIVFSGQAYLSLSHISSFSRFMYLRYITLFCSYLILYCSLFSFLIGRRELPFLPAWGRVLYYRQTSLYCASAPIIHSRY